MAWYRIGDPGQDTTAHVNFGRKRGPAPCKASKLPGDNPAIGSGCFRISVALCDGPGGTDLAGNPVTCDMPVCEHHRTVGGTNVDYCPRHKHLAPAALPLAAEG